MKEKLKSLLYWCKDNISIIISIIALCFSFYSLNIGKESNIIQENSNKLTEVLIHNSNTELMIFKKQTKFQIIRDLYEELYKFGKYNEEIRRKLQNKEKIQDEENLKTYLNTFESIYEQCRVGLISREDVRMNFAFLIGSACENSQVIGIVNNGYNGLKNLCFMFFPDSTIAKNIGKKDECR